MNKRKLTGAVLAASTAAALVPLAGCDGGMEQWGAKRYRFAGYGGPVGDAVAAGAAEVRPMSVEHRHYDIYNQYRDAFDDDAGRLLATAYGGSDSAMQATAMTFTEEQGSAQAVPSCSIRMLMMRE